MFIALGLLVLVYALVTTAMFAVFSDPMRAGRSLLFGSLAHRQAIPHVVFAADSFWSLRASGGWSRPASACRLTTFNAGLIGVSRFIYGMARDQVLPKSLATISARFNTPDRARTVLVFVIALAVSLIVYWTQRFVLLVNLAAAAESFIYAFAAACVVGLRIKDRDRERPYRMWGGLAMPGLTAVLFGVIGIGVFAQPGHRILGCRTPASLIGAAWWLYIHFFAMPRIAKARAEAAARRPSRRLPKKDPKNEDDGNE